MYGWSVMIITISSSKIMSKIKHIKDSPCWDCNVANECSAKRLTNRNLDIIVDMVWGKADYNEKNCPIYIAVTAPDMIDES